MRKDQKRQVVNSLPGKKPLFTAFLAAIFFFISIGDAFAVCKAPPCLGCDVCSCVANEHSDTRDLVEEESDDTQQHISAEFQAWQTWLVEEFWKKKILPALMDMTEQMSLAGMHAAFVIGPLIDGKNQLEVERMIQRRVAEAHKSYQPSVGVCTFGTTIRGLADAERRSEITTFVLSQRSQDRQMGNTASGGAGGTSTDKETRFKQFRERYCNLNDNNRLYAAVCDSASNAGREAYLNKDIDYTRTVDVHRTMDIDFTDTTLTDDEQDVIALASNLYAHNLFERIPETMYIDGGSGRKIEIQRQLLGQRSIIAKRSVAENSYNTIVGLKARGSEAASSATEGSSVDAEKYLRVILQELGIPPADIKTLIGERPSYYTQMEILTKKVFQQPSFYIDLYDKPANVDRKKVALQALQLMQDFDTWQSYLRTESILSILLETELERHQEAASKNFPRGGTGESRR